MIGTIRRHRASSLFKSGLAPAIIIACLLLSQACQSPLDFDEPRQIDSTSAAPDTEEPDVNTETLYDLHIAYAGQSITEDGQEEPILEFPYLTLPDVNGSVLEGIVTTSASTQTLSLNLTVTHESWSLVPLPVSNPQQITGFHLVMPAEPLTFVSPTLVRLNTDDGDEVSLDIGSIDFGGHGLPEIESYSAECQILFQRQKELVDGEFVDVVSCYVQIGNTEPVDGAEEFSFLMTMVFFILL